jgi:basic endochitinase B
MKWIFLSLGVGIAAILQSYCAVNQDKEIGMLLSKEQYQRLFPHHNPIYTYESLAKAVKSFPMFVNEGDLTDRKRELIAFLANVAHETANSQDSSYAWGLYFTEEQACRQGNCPQYNVSGTSNFKPAIGKSYYGRGPIQLSYAYNYGLAGKELGLPLLEQPELVSSDGTIGFMTAIWFWMREQKPKPSCHEVMRTNWRPTAADSLLHWRAGFGMTINIINGGVECNSQDSSIQHESAERIGFYKYFAKMLSIPIEEQCDCKGMGRY